MSAMRQSFFEGIDQSKMHTALELVSSHRDETPEQMMARIAAAVNDVEQGTHDMRMEAQVIDLPVEALTAGTAETGYPLPDLRSAGIAHGIAARAAARRER